MTGACWIFSARSQRPARGWSNAPRAPQDMMLQAMANAVAHQSSGSGADRALIDERPE